MHCIFPIPLDFLLFNFRKKRDFYVFSFIFLNVYLDVFQHNVTVTNGIQGSVFLPRHRCNENIRHHYI